MNEYIEWHYSRLNSQLKRVRKKLHILSGIPSTYAGKELLGIEKGSSYIKDVLMSDQPCMIGRYGSNELDIVAATMAYPHIDKRALIERANKGFIYSGAGFFPEGIDYLLQFGKLMEKSSGDADYIGVWFIPMEDYVIKKHTPKAAKIGLLRSLEPWYPQEIKWTEALEGKRVLVIHPFSETIESQYKRRQLLFEDSRILPEFELATIKAVQTLACQRDKRFATWYEALDYMYNQAMNQSFDIAILGCGAYGFPLASMLKRAGKKAVHMGGATQLLFGIKGSRWDNHPIISRLYNEYWVRPSENERPANSDVVEKGCYW